jgi:predicted flap endonuclease-1-like 5' DNA nuclease
MSVFFNLVMKSACRSNHHRIAVDALRHLKGEQAELWRDLFLHHHASYLEGAKAPDEVFKDFKNHVLHVRDGDWGGAPAAAREWYRRTVRALQVKDWAQAVYCAGVMTHYAADPVQPFHTHQTEEENIIHRAVEWSFSKSYFNLQRILIEDLGGYPEVVVPQSADWLEMMVKAGARTSNPHYETVVDHYDFKVGAKNPEAGLDQELKDIVAKLLGYASIMVARILERAFSEAAVAPPKVNLTLDTFFAAMKVPVNAVLKAIDNVQERVLVQSMYTEFQKTSKLRATLQEDDKTVRALHAAEVLKQPLSTIDAQWPKEIGTAHGTGTPTRAAKPKKAPAPAKAAAEKPAPAPKAKAAPAAKAAAAPAPAPAPKATAAASGQGARPRLTMDAPVEDAPSIGAKTASRLSAAGIRTVKDLLSASPDGTADQLKVKHINASVIRDWQAQAELACTVANLTSVAAQLLVATGVRDADDLGQADAETVHAMIEEYAQTSEGQRILRDGAPPKREDIERWIKAAAEAGTKRAA